MSASGRRQLFGPLDARRAALLLIFAALVLERQRVDADGLLEAAKHKPEQALSCLGAAAMRISAEFRGQGAQAPGAAA